MCVELCEWLWPFDFLAGFDSYKQIDRIHWFNKKNFMEIVCCYANTHPFCVYKWIVFIVIGVCQLRQFIAWTSNTVRMTVMTTMF